MTRVFVYGTLMEGERNHDKYLGGLTPVSKNARTAEAWYLMREFNSSSTPGAYTPVVYKTKDQEAYYIVGEVYEVDDETLAILDKLERNYDRVLIRIKGEDPAYIYLHREGQPHEGLSHHIVSDSLMNTLQWREKRLGTNEQSVAAFTAEAV